MSLKVRSFWWNRLIVLLAAALNAGCCSANPVFWTTAYYPGYRQAGMPASTIDYTALTHVIHFSMLPQANGSLDGTANSITAAGAADLVSRAHAAGRKVMICIGGAGSQSAFRTAASPSTLNAFVSNMVSFMSTNGYDGVDLDWEPLESGDDTLFSNLVTAVRTALDGKSPRPLLSAATASEPALFASLQQQFDQINVMTYDLASTAAGWVTWFNSPIYDGGYRFPSTGNLIPSADGLLKSFTSAGVASAKLSIGIAFYGYVEQGGTGTSTGGVTQPRQSWSTPPSLTAVTYNSIIAQYYQSNRYHWDSAAQAPYLSVTNTNSANDMFISFDDARSCQAKVSYARNNHLGGVMIWELGQDHTTGVPDPLLQAVKQALATPGSTSLQLNSNDVRLTWTGLALGSYRVQWSSNLAQGGWNTLLLTNMPGAGGLLQITDFGVVTNRCRCFYRVQTPP
jgi:chitinase